MDSLAFERDIRRPHRPGPGARATLALAILVLTAAGVASTGRAPQEAGDREDTAAHADPPNGRPGRRF